MAARSSVTLASRARLRLRTRVWQHPAIYLSFARLKYRRPSPAVIGSETELVIDGYTRSATTFAVYAFQLSQDRPVRLAHHLHAPAQLIEAARRGTPALLLIRDPLEAVLSQVVREPDVALGDALVAYGRFYASLLPYRGALVVGEFRDVTSDFASVIRRVNARFGTTFSEFAPTEANNSACVALIRARARFLRPCSASNPDSSRDQLHGELTELTVKSKRLGTSEAWVPSTEREHSKESLRKEPLSPDLVTLLQRARHLYEMFTLTAGQPGPSNDRPSSPDRSVGDRAGRRRRWPLTPPLCHTAGSSSICGWGSTGRRSSGAFRRVASCASPTASSATWSCSPAVPSRPSRLLG